MENKKENHVIYFKDLMFAVLRRWRAVLIVALAAALVLGGVKAVSILRKDGAASDTPYQSDLERYQFNSKVLKTEIAVLQDSMKTQQAYLENSVLMNLNPYDFYEANLKLYVDTGYQIMPDMVYQDQDKTGAVLAAYEAAYQNEQTAQKLAQVIGTQTQYAAEVVACTTAPENGTLTVAVRCADSKTGEAVLKEIVGQIEGLHAQVNQRVQEHTVEILSQSVIQRVDMSIVARRIEATDRVNAQQKALTEAEMELASLVAPRYSDQHRDSVVVNVLIFAAIGGAVGVFLCACVIWINHISSHKVYSARTLRDRTGLKVLGCVQSKNGKRGLDRWLLHKEGRCMRPAPEQLELLAAYVHNLCRDESQILVTGSDTAGVADAFVKALQKKMADKKIIGTPCLGSSTEAQLALTDSGAVVLMVQCGSSAYTTVATEAGIVADCGKKLLGCVVLDG